MVTFGFLIVATTWYVDVLSTAGGSAAPAAAVLSGFALATVAGRGGGGALAYPWLVGRLLSSTDSYVAGFALMCVTVAGVVVLWEATVRRAATG